MREFLHDTGLTPAQVDRIAYLVSHHHTLTDIDGIDYQILIEADYIVNAAENEYSKESINNQSKKERYTSATDGSCSIHQPARKQQFGDFGKGMRTRREGCGSRG